MMSISKLSTRIYFSLVVIFSIFPWPIRTEAQDLVATESLVGGSSVFVFHGSRKAPQAKALGGKVAIGARSRSHFGPSKVQLAAAAKRRHDAAIAARNAVARARANRKAALSNTLTAKADGFLDNGQTDAAISNYRAALIQNPKNKRASDGLSNALTSRGIDIAGDTNNKAALPAFEEAVKIDKNNDVAYAKMGEIYDADGQNAQAIASFESALAINPEYSTLYLPLSRAYLEEGDIAKADSLIQKSKAVGTDGAGTAYVEGLILLKQNRNDAALAAFDKVLAIDGSFAEAAYSRGRALDRSGRSDEAIAAYKRTLEIDPKYSQARFDLGVGYYNNGNYADAVTAYQQVIDQEPNYYQAHANLASTYRQLERYAEANVEYKIASEGIKTAELYSEWGYCLGKVKEWDASVARLETANKISPTAIDNSNIGWAYYNAGAEQTEAKNTDGANKNYELAKQYLEAAVRMDPQLDAALLNLGSTHNGLGEFEDAVKVLTTALGLHRNWTIASNQLGLGYRGLGDLNNAIATFKSVVALDESNTFGLYNLGESYYLIGNKKEAKKVNDKLKRIDPTLGAKLDNVISGKVLIDGVKQKINQKIPKIPRIPF